MWITPVGKWKNGKIIHSYVNPCSVSPFFFMRTNAPQPQPEQPQTCGRSPRFLRRYRNGLIFFSDAGKRCTNTAFYYNKTFPFTEKRGMILDHVSPKLHGYITIKHDFITLKIPLFLPSCIFCRFFRDKSHFCPFFRIFFAKKGRKDMFLRISPIDGQLYVCYNITIQSKEGGNFQWYMFGLLSW